MEANRSLRFNTKKQAETFIVDQGVNGGFAVIGSAHWIPDVWLVDVYDPSKPKEPEYKPAFKLIKGGRQ